MKTVLAVFAALLVMAQVAMPQGGMMFNAGAVYVSNYQGETNMTFQTASRPCRVWSSNYNTLIRFDESDLASIPCGAPCTLYFSKDGRTTDADNVWNSNNINIYLLKGTWLESGNDVDQTNFADAPSWDYRGYPAGWKTGAAKAEPVTGAFARKNTKAGNNGPDLATPGFCVIDKAVIDDMRNGVGAGFILQPGSGCMLWLPHIGHQMNYGDGDPAAVCPPPSNAVEANVKNLAKLSLNASPNPFNAMTTLSVGLRGTDKNASLVVYNMNGQKVADLSAQLASGKSANVSWNAAAMPNGVYVAKLVAGKTQLVRNLTLVR